ncbi:MAG TPA: o-succinylbenzoate synthase [Acidimicrobiales bacterium]|nr:o-succinylbenzoate synthase [Acidimicrobiales bacterium]
MLPLVTPFRTSFGTESAKDVVVLRYRRADGAEGWGECVALSEPTYSSEYAAGAHHVLEHHLLPRVLAGRSLDDVQGHAMAKAAVEMAVLDAALRAGGVSLATHLGGVRDAVDAGVSVGMTDTTPALVAAVEAYLAEGYVRIKCKVEPGCDVEPLAAVRAAVGPDVLLQVDANAAYSIDDAEHLACFDELGLLLIEQPLPARDLRGHAALAARLRTPICLDESIESLDDAGEALDAGACSIVNIKSGRVGGLAEAVRIHDLCARRGVPVWCGGMLETGLGRAANVALASLPGFTLPGDLSASRRWFEEDLTEPFELVGGQLRVPTGPGLGVTPVASVLHARTQSVTLVR